MRRGRAILSFALALLWLGLPVHCQLETVAASSILACCVDSDCPPQRDSDCAEDFCGSLESGDYFPQKSSVSLKLPLIHVLFLQRPVVPEDLARPLIPHSNQIPLLTGALQFLLRSVAQPRAPSSDS